jgi:hypothetical protein
MMKVFKSVLPTGLWGVLMAIMLLLPSCAEHPYQQGQILYENFCSSCHMSDGLIRYGITDTIIVNGKTYNNPMAGIPNLTEFEIANIINYVNQAWGHELAVVRVSDLQKQLDECLPDYYPKK